MTGKGNRFGIGPVDVPADFPSRRSRDPGPMGVAVRESAANAQEASETLVEQRRQNANDAKLFRVAQQEGRVLVHLPIDRIGVASLPRDRIDLGAVAASDEMDELKASIRDRGQREPIEVFLSGSGEYELKTGWRRLTALRQLYEETSDARFATVTARVTVETGDRADLYIDMVEENVIRQDLSFSEMAGVAIALSRDAQAGVSSVDEAVNRLFRSVHKVKRAYIRSFVALLLAVGDVLPFPKTIARDIGVEAARKLQEGEAQVQDLRSRLAGCTTEAAQAEALRDFVSGSGARVAKGDGAASAAERQKFEFHVGDSKVTARKGEFRIKASIDFASVERQVLERAVRAFHAALGEKT